MNISHLINTINTARYGLTNPSVIEPQVKLHTIYEIVYIIVLLEANTFIFVFKKEEEYFY